MAGSSTPKVKTNENKPYEVLADIESCDHQQFTWNVGMLVEYMDSGIADFDIPIQRGLVWTRKDNSEVIWSVITRFPLSDFCFNREGKFYKGLDGKQRSNAIYRFIKDEYALHESIPPILVDGALYELKGKKFSQMPKLRNRILGCGIYGHYFNNLTIAEQKRLFRLKNSGRRVTAAELTHIGAMSWAIFRQLAMHPAIVESMGTKGIQKMYDRDTVEKLWCMCFGGAKSLEAKHIGPILEVTEVTPEQNGTLRQALDYLKYLYDEISSDKKIYNNMKKRSHVLSLGYMGYLALQSGMDKDTYAQYAAEFFNPDEEGEVTVSKAYNEAVNTGSAKSEPMRVRKEEIRKALELDDEETME